MKYSFSYFKGLIELEFAAGLHKGQRRSTALIRYALADTRLNVLISSLVRLTCFDQGLDDMKDNACTPNFNNRYFVLSN